MFPSTTHLLCRWHHKQNVRTNCNKFFATDELWQAFQSDWLHCIDAPTKAEFKTRWAAMSSLYRRRKPQAVNFLQKNWCGVKLPKIAKFGTDQAFHLFNTATSRAESAHHVLKDILGTSNGDFKFVIDAIKLACENQSWKLYTRMDNDRTTYNRIYYNNPIFSDCVGTVSSFAITEIQKQFNLISSDRDIGECTGAFTRTSGLPCKHFLYQHITDDPN